MALVGMGGFGKSQLAIQFAHHIHAISPQTSVFWVYAKSKPRFEEAYASITKAMGIPGHNNPAVDILSLVRDWLQREDVGPWLMILDNADDASIFHPSHEADTSDGARSLLSFLPRRSGGMVLTTSRSLDASERITGTHKTIFRIPPFDSTQALQLLHNKLVVEFDEDSGRASLEVLGNIPLAINQAAAYINRRHPRVSVENYLEDFQKSDKEKGSLLNIDAGDLRRDETVSNAVVTAWQVTFEQIKRESSSAAQLLSLMSFFNAQGIPDSFLLPYTDHLWLLDVDLDEAQGTPAEEEAGTARGTADKSWKRLEDDLDVLHGYSLISTTGLRGQYEMHSLVQLCTHVWLASMKQLRQWRSIFLRTIRSLACSIHNLDLRSLQCLLPHVELILVETKAPKGRDMDAWLMIHFISSIYNFQRGDLTGGPRPLEKAVGLCLAENPNCWGLGVCIQRLVGQHLKCGNYDAAVELATLSMDVVEKTNGMDCEVTLSLKSGLANAYLEQSQLAEAKTLMEEVLRTARRALAIGSAVRFHCMDIMAKVYRGLGDFGAYEALASEIIENGRHSLGAEHPATLWCMLNLSIAYKDDGWQDQAESLVAEILRILSGPHIQVKKDPEGLWYWFGLLEGLGRGFGLWAETEAILTRVLETQRVLLGDDHNHVKLTMRTLCDGYYYLGRLQEAEIMAADMIRIRRKALGEEHPSRLDDYRYLMGVYERQERWKEAEDLMVAELAIQRRVLGQEAGVFT